jgi:hypothetical protein
MLHLAAGADQTVSLLWPQLITSIASVFTAMAILVGAIGGIIPLLKKINGVADKLTIVHTIVNQQHTDMLRYQVALTDALTSAGVSVPSDQSLNATPIPPEMPS